MIYLDYAAGTPVKPEVLKAYNNTLKKYYANPNSYHRLGREAQKLIADSTKNIAHNLNVLEEEIIYTSGSSETNNLVVKGICGRYKAYGKHILISALEHNSIVSACASMQELGFEVEVIPFTKDGYVSLEELKKMLREDTILVSICSVDSELGLIQPIEEIATILKDYPHCYFHTDATQSFGKVAIDFTNVDLVTISSHKISGLPSSSILIKKKNVGLKSQINGGKSTTIYRSGTPDVAAIADFDKAIELCLASQDQDYKYIENLSNIIKNKLREYKNIVINTTSNSIPHTINFSLKGVRSLEVMQKFDAKDIYISTKTSCCPLETPSKLVYALTQDKSLSTSSLRVSLSALTTENEVNKFLKELDVIYKEYY